VNDPEPVVFREWIQELLQSVGTPPVRRTLPLGVAVGVGAVLEALWSLFRLSGEPPLTRFVARNLGTDHWYATDEAARDFGYAPPVAARDGLRETILAFRKS
jgi:hypothetical protein